MEKVYLSLGSNFGNSELLIEKAINFINEKKDIQITKKSKLYKTEPWGVKEQDWFLNLIIEINTNLSPLELLATCNKIEEELGRNRKIEQRWGQRPIDIDIIFYGKEIINNDKLTIPHKHMHERAFVLVPLNEINPNFTHPILKTMVKDLLENLKNAEKVYEYERKQND